jgi:hypothetical protein
MNQTVVPTRPDELAVCFIQEVKTTTHSWHSCSPPLLLWLHLLRNTCLLFSCRTARLPPTPLLLLLLSPAQLLSTPLPALLLLLLPAPSLPASCPACCSGCHLLLLLLLLVQLPSCCCQLFAPPALCWCQLGGCHELHSGDTTQPAATQPQQAECGVMHVGHWSDSRRARG